MITMNYCLVAAVLVCPLQAFAAPDAAAYADLDARRSKVDDFVAKERLKNSFTSERLMTRNQVKDFLKEVELEITHLEASFKPDANAGNQQLKEAIGELRKKLPSIKKNPYCLVYNTSLLWNMNGVVFQATGLGVIDVRTLMALNRLIVKESNHVEGLASIFENELLYPRR